MTITTTISKYPETGYVQVNASNKNGSARYYKVPEVKSKIFSEKLKKQDKDFQLYSNIGFFTSIVAGILLVNTFTKKMNSYISKILVQSSSAIAVATLTSLGIYSYAQNEHTKLLNRYKAKEIFYDI